MLCDKTLANHSNPRDLPLSSMHPMMQPGATHMLKAGVINTNPREAACSVLLGRRRPENFRRGIHCAFKKLPHMTRDAEHVPHGCGTDRPSDQCAAHSP